MTNHRILLSTPMVRARLAGIKTVTRRLITPRNSRFRDTGVEVSSLPYAASQTKAGAIATATFKFGGHGWPLTTHCIDATGTRITRHEIRPHVRPGDQIIWSETFRLVEVPDLAPWQHLCDGRPMERTAHGGHRFAVYRTDPTDAVPGGPDAHWRPSLFMPAKWARLKDTVTAVTPQPLSAISPEDAVAEGALTLYPDMEPVAAFMRLWEDINGPGSSRADTWVWVYRFTHGRSAVPGKPTGHDQITFQTM